eukprot:6481130-Pyramimonas_sp.AAC.1
MSIPDYSVADHEGLSATWLDRAPLRLDAECVPPAFEDRGDLSAAGAERAVEADCQMSEDNGRENLGWRVGSVSAASVRKGA